MPGREWSGEGSQTKRVSRGAAKAVEARKTMARVENILVGLRYGRFEWIRATV